MNKNGLPNGFILRKSTRISVIFTNFASNLKHFNTMAKLNRIKLVLVEKGKLANGLQQNSASQIVLLANGVATSINPISIH